MPRLGIGKSILFAAATNVSVAVITMIVAEWGNHDE
jgi:hypothetical protein